MLHRVRKIAVRRGGKYLDHKHQRFSLDDDFIRCMVPNEPINLSLNYQNDFLLFFGKGADQRIYGLDFS